MHEPWLPFEVLPSIRRRLRARRRTPNRDLISSDVIRAGLMALSPMLKQVDVESARTLQGRKGELMAFPYRHSVVRSAPQDLGEFEVCWTQPARTPRNGAVLYLHGGGYVTGDFQYMMGFGSTLTATLGRRVLSAAYRLAPEHPYPAALDDAVTSYRHILDKGYDGGEIVLIGESAGGGLVIALALKLRDMGLPLPAGIVALSPWTDLALSGASYRENEKNEPSLSMEMVEFCAEAYAGDDRLNPYISPLYADFEGFPPCLIIAGGSEMLVDDSTRIAGKMRASGVDVTCHVEPKMWHVYVMFAGISESRAAMVRISEFVDRVIR